MSSTEASSNTSMRTPEAGTIDMKLEVVTVPVSDVDRAKELLHEPGMAAGRGHRPSRRLPGGPAHAPPFGVLDRLREGRHHRRAGIVPRLILAVDDIDAARGGPHRPRNRGQRGVPPRRGPVPGPDPQNRSYQTYASFSDPDGNGWLLQEITSRLPGREWEDLTMDIASRASLLRETARRAPNLTRLTPRATVGLACRLYGRARARGGARARVRVKVVGHGS